MKDREASHRDGEMLNPYTLYAMRLSLPERQLGPATVVLDERPLETIKATINAVYFNFVCAYLNFRARAAIFSLQDTPH